MMNNIEYLIERLEPYTLAVANHGIYNQITTLEKLRLFMGQHIFAVWDFMCLLKELHRNLVTTSSPWFPPKDALSANLISSILVEEEGDLAEDGTYLSHYELYIKAMNEVGADIAPINQMLALLKEGNTIENALKSIPINSATKEFILTTFSFFKFEVHELAAAFVFGREGITGSMFLSLLQQLENNLSDSDKRHLNTIIFYFKRHIDLDDNEHFPKAIKMLSNLTGNDKNKFDDVERIAKIALQARSNFLTGIQKSF